MTTDKLAWVPFDPGHLGDLPDGLRVQRQPRDVDWSQPPAAAAEVAFWVVPGSVGGEEVARTVSAMPALEVVQTLSAGVEHVAPHVPDGAVLCNARGVHDASTAELAVGLALASLRGIPDFVRDAERHVWDQHRRRSLADRRVMILGYGSIGRAVERRLAPFEVEVVRVARTAREGVHGLEEVESLLGGVDVVVLVVPATEETRGMVDAGFLAAMRDGALLVNVARGSVVDTDALVAELRRGRVTAALDVTDPEPLPEDHPLWECPGVLVTPHVGGLTDAMWPRAHRLVADQLGRYAAGRDLANTMTGAY